MLIYQLELTAHDDVFFATYEMGRLIETGPYLHNYALSYALFENYLTRPYRQVGASAQKPGYLDPEDERSLLPLNDRGIYVFPGKPLKIERLPAEHTLVNSVLPIEEGYFRPTRQEFGTASVHRRKNRPFGLLRCKGLWAGTQHQVFVVSHSAINILAWIRLGKWAAKVRVEVVEVFTDPLHQAGEFKIGHPVNPIDLSVPLRGLHNRIVMPPSSLISAAWIEGPHWNLEGVCLPQGMFYGASSASLSLR